MSLTMNYNDISGENQTFANCTESGFKCGCFSLFWIVYMSISGTGTTVTVLSQLKQAIYEKETAAVSIMTHHFRNTERVG